MVALRAVEQGRRAADGDAGSRCPLFNPTVARGADEGAIVGGIEACLRNASDLVKAAKLLLEAQLHAPSLSLAILAMEEVGKTILIDGLIFAQPEDERAELLKRGGRQHRQKLQALDMFPLLLRELATLDQRFDTEQSFQQTFVFMVESYRHQRSALSPWLGPECCLVNLDWVKQEGFYVNRRTDHSFVLPHDAINKGFAAAVVDLAWLLTDSVNFLLKTNWEAFRERVRRWRETISPEALRQIRSHAEAIVSEAFGEEDPA